VSGSFRPLQIQLSGPTAKAGGAGDSRGGREVKICIRITFHVWEPLHSRVWGQQQLMSLVSMCQLWWDWTYSSAVFSWSKLGSPLLFTPFVTKQLYILQLPTGNLPPTSVPSLGAVTLADQYLSMIPAQNGKGLGLTSNRKSLEGVNLASVFYKTTLALQWGKGTAEAGKDFATWSSWRVMGT
jgi:hypothetical protein